MHNERLMLLGHRQYAIIMGAPHGAIHVSNAALDWCKDWLANPGPALVLYAYHNAHLINHCGQRWLDEVKEAMDYQRIDKATVSVVDPGNQEYIDLSDEEPDDFDCGSFEKFGCLFPDKCCMPSPNHFPSECYTVEDAEAAAQEQAHYDETHPAPVEFPPK